MPRARRIPGSRLLIAEPPLQVLPSLAVRIGLHEAIVLQQLHYWLLASKHEHDGRVWVYNTLEEWHSQFPFMSLSTLRRTMANLEQQCRLVLTARYNRLPTDRTKWYTIDYDALETLGLFAAANANERVSRVTPTPTAQPEQLGNVQNEQMSRSQRADGRSNLSGCNQETPTEKTPIEHQPGDLIERPRTGGLAGEETVRRVFIDFCREFGDEASDGSIGTRAVNLWRRSRLSRDAFIDLARDARRQTRLYQGRQPPGKVIAAKAAYFFVIIETAIYERSRSGIR